jgi:hypothetical protein
MEQRRSLGLPLRCPKCAASRRYFGVLKGEQTPTKMVKLNGSDICPNCKTKLVRCD